MKRIFVLSLILSLIIACINDDVDEAHECDFKTYVSLDQYANAPNDKLTINQLDIDGECLRINFSSGGCDGESWEIKLIDSGNVYGEELPQRNLRLSLKNEELCEAYITKELTFDISGLKVGGNKVQLNLVNSGDSILFEY